MEASQLKRCSIAAHTHTHTLYHLVTARVQMVAMKHAATTSHPHPPSGGLVVRGTILSPPSFSSLPTLADIAPARTISADFLCQRANGALEVKREHEWSHRVQNEAEFLLKGKTYVCQIQTSSNEEDVKCRG